MGGPRTRPQRITRGFEEARRRQRRAERLACPVHDYQRHGKEAQELRAGIETLLESMTVSPDMLDASDARAELAGARMALAKLLDDVDARDSLAYLERNPSAGRKDGRRG